mgnify:CR=1 FL=1
MTIDWNNPTEEQKNKLLEIYREFIIEECTEGCTTYSTYCEYNHN